MKELYEERSLKTPIDRIEGKAIILDSEGEFPKKVIIWEKGKAHEYLIKKTRKGKYLFN